MKLAISTSWNYAVPFDKSIELIRSSGFELISIGGRESHSRYHKPDGRERIREVCALHGVTIDSIHASFGSTVDISDPEEVLRRSASMEIAREIRACSDLGVKTLIMHISGFKIDDISARMKQLRKSLDELLEIAEKEGVSLAAENLGVSMAKILLKYALDMFDTPRLGLCFDNGHAELNREDYDILAHYSSRLYAVHLHDNDGSRDLHMLPFEGSCDLPNLAAQLNKAERLCPITVESEVANSSYKSPETFLSQARESGDRFLEMLKHE